MNSGNALIQHVSEKMRCSCFPVLPGSAEAQVIWGGTVKRLLIAHFIGNIFAKKYQNAFTYVTVIANQRWDVFEAQCIFIFINHKGRRKNETNKQAEKKRNLTKLNKSTKYVAPVQHHLHIKDSK